MISEALRGRVCIRQQCVGDWQKNCLLLPYTASLSYMNHCFIYMKTECVFVRECVSEREYVCKNVRKSGSVRE